ncbi:MAG: pilus assembly protein PilM [bacterium]
MFFLTPKDISVGLDIGSHSIKLIKIKRGKKIKIINSGNILLPGDLIRGSFVNGNIRDKKVFTEKIKELFLKTGVYDKEIAIGMPDTCGRSVFLELENVPAEREDAKELIIWKLKKEADLNLDKNFAVDYQVLEKETKDKKEFNKLFAVLVNKNILAEYEESLRQSGLKPVSVVLSSFGLVNFFNFVEKGGGSYLIINFGHQVTTLLIIKNRKLDFFRPVDTGGRDFTTRIKDHFSISWEDAESKKMKDVFFPGDIDVSKLIEMGLLDNFSSIKPAQGNLAREISASLQYYKNKAGGGAVEKIFLAGGSAEFKNINIFFKNIFNLDTFKINQTDEINFVQSKEPGCMSNYASATGLLI